MKGNVGAVAIFNLNVFALRYFPIYDFKFTFLKLSSHLIIKCVALIGKRIIKRHAKSHKAKVQISNKHIGKGFSALL